MVYNDPQETTTRRWPEPGHVGCVGVFILFALRWTGVLDWEFLKWSTKKRKKLPKVWIHHLLDFWMSIKNIHLIYPHISTIAMFKESSTIVFSFGLAPAGAEFVNSTRCFSFQWSPGIRWNWSRALPSGSWRGRSVPWLLAIYHIHHECMYVYIYIPSH